MVTIPKWADEAATKSLGDWVAEGESTTQEFKVEIPEQTRKLAQEVSALATSGGGRVLIGVSDAAEIVGLPLNSGSERDACFERLQGIIDTVRPDLTTDLLFAVAESCTVVVIEIPKQSEPVFYVDHRPYIRDKRRSRPARPAEVQECVWAHPSSEHQRAKERLKEQQLSDIIDSGRAFSEQHHRRQ